MSQPEPGRPANTSGARPYSAPGPVPGHADPGTGTPGSDTASYEEWQHGGGVSDDPGSWGLPQEYGPPPDWPGEATFVPGNDDSQPPWDDSSGSAPYGTPPRQQRRQFPARLTAAATALLLAAAAAITVATFPRNSSIHPSPAGNPGATASQHRLGATTGAEHGGTPSPAAQPPAITKAEAGRVLSAYWHISNKANEQRSDSLLRTIEGGTSYRMDSGAYRFDRVTDPSNSDYAPIQPIRAAYYIPRLATDDYPRWFVAVVTYARLTSPQHPAGSGYLLFRQASAGAAWKDVLEPDVLPGSGPAPHIATDAEGYATAVDPTGDAGLSIAPRQIGPVTASSLDGSSTSAIKAPRNLTDLHDEAFWQSRLPAGSTDTDEHQAGSAPVFGLRTKDGGALLFYHLAARLTLAPPRGETFALTIPGYYAPNQTLTSAAVGYIEQFATYDPPQGQTHPYIAADVSGIASRD